MAQLTARCPSCNNYEKVKELLEGLTKISQSIDVLEKLTQHPNKSSSASFDSSSIALISNIRSVLVKSGIKTKHIKQEHEEPLSSHPVSVDDDDSTSNINPEETIYDSWCEDGLHIKEEEMTDEEFNDDEFSGAVDPLDDHEEDVPISEMIKLEDTSEDAQEVDRTAFPTKAPDPSLTRLHIVRQYNYKKGRRLLPNEQPLTNTQITRTIAAPEHFSPIKVREVGRPSGRRTAYSFFVEKYWVQIKTELGLAVSSNYNFSLVSQECSMRWKALTEEDKRKYASLAEQDTKRYNAEMEKYVPPAGAKKKKKKKSPDAPKRALTPFFWFCVDERPRIRSMNGADKLTLPALSKELSRRWSVAPLTVKQKYETISAKDRQRYDSEIREYRERTGDFYH